MYFRTLNYVVLLAITISLGLMQIFIKLKDIEI